MLGAVSVVMETSSGVGCQEQPGKEKMATAKCPPPTPNLITQYFKSPPKPEVTSPKPSGILGYFKPMGKSPSQQLSCKPQEMAGTKVASPIAASKSTSEKDTDKPMKEKETKTKLKKVAKAKNKKPVSKDEEEVKDQEGNQKIDEKESGKVKELKKTGTEPLPCSRTENGEGATVGNNRKSKKRKKSDVFNSSVDEFEAQPKKASKVSVSAAPEEKLTTSQDGKTSEGDKKAKFSTKTEDGREEIKQTATYVKKQNTPHEVKGTRQSSEEGRGEVGGVNHCRPAEETLIDRSTAEIDPGDDSVMMISYHDYLTSSQSEAEEEEDDKVATDVIDPENNDPENVEVEISYSDLLKGGVEERKDNTEGVNDVDETSNQEIPYEEFVKNISNTSGEDDVSKPSGETLGGSPNSSGQGKVVTVEAQVHSLKEEHVSKQKHSEVLKQGKRASTPKTKGRKKSNVVVEEVDLVIEESSDNNKKVNEEKMRIQISSTTKRDDDPETRARKEEMRKNFMANFRQPSTKKKVAETEDKNEESAKEEQEKEREVEDVKADKKRSAKSSQPAAKTNTRARKPAAKKASVGEEEDKGKQSPALKKTGKADRKNTKKKVTVEDTTSTKVKKKTDKKTARKKKAEAAKEAESVEVVEPEVEETPRRRSGRKCVYRSQLLSMGSPNTPSPIRLRLTRVARRKQGQLENPEDFTPKSKKKAKNAKVTKAQELVQKAKAQKSSKAKAKAKSRPQAKVTRPKRQTAKPKSPEVVEITDETTMSTPRSKRVKAKHGAAKVVSPKGKKRRITPKKEAPKVGKDGKPLRSFLDVLGKKKVSSPRKAVGSPRKAAAIFSSFGKNLAKDGRSSPLTILDEDSRGSGSESSMDEATFAARRNFLMSGIPDRLRKQITITAAQAQAYMYPSFPTVSHVQQRDTVIPDGHPDFWNLPHPEEGSIPTMEFQTDWNSEGKVWKGALHLGAVTTCKYKDVIKKEPRTPVAQLSHAVCKSLVAEIGTYCPGVPVRRVYKRYRSRYLEHQGTEHQEQDSSQTTCSQPVASVEPTVLKDKKSNKRKLSEVTEGHDHNTNKRKRTEEESEGQRNSPEVQESRKRSRLSRKSKMAHRNIGQESNTPQQSDGEGGRRRSGRTKRNSSPSEEKEEPRRRSGRRASKKQEEESKEHSEEEVKIVEEAPTESSETNQDGIHDSLWTDKYQPRSSSEVIGNTGAMKKLKSWLHDWKIRADKEMRRMMKEMKKQKKAQKNAAKKSGSQGSGDWWDDDDSDFDISDDGDSDYNEEEEEDGLCNTMLLLGPTGIGKTSAVYACAQELGYKVFEVNAASLRSGKQVLTQLREATQSHQVSKQAQTGGAASLFKTSLTPQKVKPGANKASLPSSFASFFKKTEDGKKEEDSKGPAGNKKVRRSLELGPSSKAKGNKKEKKSEKRRSSKGSGDKKSSGKQTEAKPAATQEPTRAMTSLILFEEVDVVFEDDKGFLPAINTLMTTTKRPIILTTSDVTFPARFEGRYEELTFKQPLQPIVTSHLQLLCLAENLPTKRADVEATVALSRGDIRHAMLSLQFWAESGGGRVEKQMASDLHKVATNTENAPQPVQIEECSQSQTCDTADISLKPGDKTTMVLGPLPDYEDAMDTDDFLSCRKTTATLRNEVPLAADDTCDSCPSSQEVAMATVAMETSPETVDIHSQSMESVLGIHNIAGCKNQLLEMYKTQDSDQGCLARQISLTASCQWQGRNLLFYNVEQLLPLPITPWIRPKCNNSNVLRNVPSQDEEKGGGKRRKGDSLLDSSLFDAEDLPSSQPKDATTEEDKKSLQEVTEERTKNDDDVDAQSCSTVVEKEENVFKKRLICQALASFCELSENKSFLDLHTHRSSQKEGLCKIDQSAWRAKVKSGMTDRVRIVEESDWRTAEMGAELRAAVEVMSMRQCARAVGKLASEFAQDSGSKDLCEELTLPVVGDAANLRTVNLQDETQAQLSMFNTRYQTVHGVMSALPNLSHGQHRAIALDYLPTLRSICATEKLREASKLKRRFLHYLDNNGLSLKPSVLNALSQEF